MRQQSAKGRLRTFSPHFRGKKSEEVDSPVLVEDQFFAMEMDDKDARGA